MIPSKEVLEELEEMKKVPDKIKKIIDTNTGYFLST